MGKIKVLEAVTRSFEVVSYQKQKEEEKRKEQNMISLIDAGKELPCCRSEKVLGVKDL